MKILTLLLSLMIFICSSCNNTDTAPDMNVNHNSLKAAIKNEVDIAGREAEVNSAKIEIEKLSKALDDSKASLIAEKEKMDKIKEWHFARSRDKRDKEIQNQQLKISDNERIVKELEDKITRLKRKIVVFSKGR